MNISTWKDSLTLQKPPAMPALAEALWWEARGNWERAHTIAQDVHGPEGAWVHAYLHRREGDQGNAAYWYRQTRKPACREPLDAERKAIVEALLSVSSNLTPTGENSRTRDRLSQPSAKA